MKNRLSFILFLLFPFLLFSQEKQTKTILYLIPFHTDMMENINPDLMKREDMDKLKPFQLISFWQGAQIALEHFESEKIQLSVIVKDISSDETQLKQLMENQELMKSVDLMIGPFYSNLFAIAASYAKHYQIPIVNPFTTRTDFLADNEFVYKAMPSKEDIPLSIYQSLIEYNVLAKVFIWAEDTIAQDVKAFQHCFEQNEVQYKMVPFLSNIKNLLQCFVHQEPERENIVIVSSKNEARIIQNIRLMEDVNLFPEGTIFLVPEQWMDLNQSDLEILNRLQVHYYSNYYVNYADEKTQNFIQEFQTRFFAFPTLKRYAFQGFDITNYFIDILINDFQELTINPHAISMGFKFVKIPKGGYENRQYQFLKLQNYEILPMK